VLGEAGFKVDMVDGECVIAPFGCLVLDGQDVANLEQALEQALKHRRGVALDLSRVDLIDTTGLALIVRSYRSACENGISFRLVNPTRRIQEILRITKLDEIIPVSCDADKERDAAGGAGAG
jgi:anti-anti-sigma factor